jgi:hypothetical protein
VAFWDWEEDDFPIAYFFPLYYHLEVGIYLLSRKTAYVIVSPNLVEDTWLTVGLVHIKRYCQRIKCVSWISSDTRPLHCCRMLYAFSRDGAVPLSRFWVKVNRQEVPLYAVWLSAFIAFCMALTVQVSLPFGTADVLKRQNFWLNIHIELGLDNQIPLNIYSYWKRRKPLAQNYMPPLKHIDLMLKQKVTAPGYNYAVAR